LRQRDFGPHGAFVRFRVLAHRRERGGAESRAVSHSIIAINQKNAPSRDARNPLNRSRFEPRAAAPARQGK
jgi:hypothetical protein